MVGRGGGEFSRTGVDGFEHGPDAQRLACCTHCELISLGEPGDLTIGIAQLLETEEVLAAEVRQCPTLEQLGFCLNQQAQLRQEPGVNPAERMDLLITATGDHRRTHAEDAIRGGRPQ